MLGPVPVQHFGRYLPNASAFDRRDKSVPASRQGLDEPRSFRGISQRLTDLVDRGVQVVVDVDEGVWPQPFLQFFARHYVAGLLEQDGQNLDRLAGKLQLLPILAQLARSKVQFERSETRKTSITRDWFHRSLLSLRKSSTKFVWCFAPKMTRQSPMPL